VVAVDGEDGEVVAFIAVDVSGDDDATDGVGEVGAIYARARVWGAGTGRQLMDVGLDLLWRRGCDEATLWVLDTNERARRFYEAGGWSIDGATKVEIIGGAEVNELRYRRSLR
jgi:GNAT superfamily N-acetyltransferase